MKRHKQKLSSEEKAILNAFESGKLKSIPNVKTEKNAFKSIAKAHGLKKSK
jgi:hypothetical protein